MNFDKNSSVRTQRCDCCLREIPEKRLINLKENLKSERISPNLVRETNRYIHICYRCYFFRIISNIIFILLVLPSCYYCVQLWEKIPYPSGALGKVLGIIGLFALPTAMFVVPFLVRYIIRVITKCDDRINNDA